MATSEKRFPRGSFTKKLLRICERLDECATRTISFKHFIFRHREITTEVTVTSLWVAGSYARGATDCGDLDLVLHAEPPRDLPPQPTLTKAFFGALPYVSYYLGTPSENQSGIEFPEAVQIWSGPGCNWRAAIDAINVDPAAGRHARKRDEIPLRREQVHVELDDLDEVVDLRAQGILEWEFLEISDASLRPVPDRQIAAREEYLLRCAGMWGKATQRLIPAALRLMREREPHGTWQEWHRAPDSIKCGGTELHLGRPRLPVERLNGDPSVRQLALAPHISVRGPNGFWLIRRGPNHPDLTALGGRSAYYLSGEGEPSLMNSRNERSREASVLELFTTKARATREAKGWNQDSDLPPLQVALLCGADLLRLTGLCDVVDIDGSQFSITWPGTLYTEARKEAKVGDLAAKLPISKPKKQTQ